MRGQGRCEGGGGCFFFSIFVFADILEYVNAFPVAEQIETQNPFSVQVVEEKKQKIEKTSLVDNCIPKIMLYLF